MKYLRVTYIIQKNLSSSIKLVSLKVISNEQSQFFLSFVFGPFCKIIESFCSQHSCLDLREAEKVTLQHSANELPLHVVDV